MKNVTASKECDSPGKVQKIIIISKYMVKKYGMEEALARLIEGKRGKLIVFDSKNTKKKKS